jgi:hypothetical protein
MRRVNPAFHNHKTPNPKENLDTISHISYIIDNKYPKYDTIDASIGMNFGNRNLFNQICGRRTEKNAWIK